ncbi:hypothetical protein IAQ61_000727 [Plenodomus lingam]|uniref:uncharacterized protein n=1 Tax=Leptosphaeria maculans TaxID=5022 RepID=UPI00332E1063|nr:hypothetical protein IAQ61_000727 [Plenodomus lingam]
MRPSLRPPCLRTPWLNLGYAIPTPHIYLYIPRRIATTSTTNTAPIDLPKLVISPGSPHHNSLPTFLAYAQRVNLTPDKTIYVGTHYEYTTALALMRLGFSLLRIGRTNDAGIDLIGHWILGPLREPLPVIVQCKARKFALSPSHVRELEGSFQGTPADWKKKDVLGLLVTTRKATKGILQTLSQSRWPMGFVLVSRAGLVEQFVWNRAASEKGLEGVGVTVRHTPRALLDPVDIVPEEDPPDEPEKTKKRHEKKFKNTGTQKDIQLIWMGSPIFPDRHVLDPQTLGLMRYIVPGDDPPNHASPIRDLRYTTKVGVPKYKSTAMAPSPRGGEVRRQVQGRPRTEIPARPRGRPRKLVEAETPTIKAKKAGSKTNKKKGIVSEIQTDADQNDPVQPTAEKRRPGRPKGSKNKPKLSADPG